MDGTEEKRSDTGYRTEKKKTHKEIKTTRRRQQIRKGENKALTYGLL